MEELANLIICGRPLAAWLRKDRAAPMDTDDDLKQGATADHPPPPRSAERAGKKPRTRSVKARGVQLLVG